MCDTWQGDVQIGVLPFNGNGGVLGGLPDKTPTPLITAVIVLKRACRIHKGLSSQTTLIPVTRSQSCRDPAGLHLQPDSAVHVVIDQVEMAARLRLGSALTDSQASDPV